MKKNDKKYTIANAAGFIFPVTTVYMATYVIELIVFGQKSTI